LDLVYPEDRQSRKKKFNGCCRTIADSTSLSELCGQMEKVVYVRNSSGASPSHSLFVLVLFLVTAPAWAQWGTAVIDGVITPGEYGNNNTVGTNTAQNWYITWDATNLYVGIALANLSEGTVIYIGPNPQSDPKCCNDSDGNLTGFTYNNTNFASLPFRAKFVTYYKDDYREYRNSDGSGGWTGAIANYGQYASGAGKVREIAIPWSAINQNGGLPTHFVFFGYLTSSRGYVYGQVPNDNPGLFIGTGATYTQYYNISNTGNGPVHIEQVIADGKTYDASSGLRLAPLVRDLAIDYTGLSFVAPEKVLFRYKLEGWDRDWQNVGNRRHAFYTNLAPGHYRFRVIASNNSGVWNEQGATLDFAIAPVYWQTNWFRALCVVAFLALVYGAYRFRVQQLQRQFNVGLEARLNERTRIARELHDTLLQNFHGLMFQFQAASNLMLRRPDEAKESLDDAIVETKKAIAESRDAIQGLRSEPIAKGNLAELLMSTSRELADANGSEHQPVFDLIEEGERWTLSPTVSNDICRIALELMRNAYQHAHARRIEAEIRYGRSMFRLRIRDDGKGIEPKVLKEGGKVGHWGLRGARERADRIGAHLDLWSEPGNGTEVQLLVPPSIACESYRDSYPAKLVRKLKRDAQRS
jgi:signal transduction histidine kinase